MSIFDNFTGGKSRKDLWAGVGAANNYLDQGTATADGLYEQSLAEQRGYIDPYVESSTGATRLYTDALGINGLAPQQAYFNGFQNDPGYQAVYDSAIQAGDRAANAGGRRYSGANILSQGRLGGQLQNQMFSQRMDRLAQLGQSGQQVAGLGASMTAQNYGDRANLAYGTAQQKAGLVTGASNAAANTRSMGINNLFKIGELAVNAYGASKKPGGDSGDMAKMAKLFMGG